MASKVEIFNMALGLAKTKSSVTDVAETSNEANKCNLYYDTARKATLEGHNWSFARRTTTLALVGTAQTGWIYQYAYPADCVKVRKILSINRTDNPLPFAIAHSELSDAKVILTDTESAEIEYTKDVTNTVMFTNIFTIAMAARLAAFIAVPLTGKESVAKMAMDVFTKALAEATAANLSENEKDAEPLPNWLQDRQ